MPEEQRAHARTPVTHGEAAQEGAAGTIRHTTHGALPLLAALAPLSGVTARDTATVYLTVLLRLLAFEQVRELVFPEQDASVVRRRARRIEEAGWIVSWDAAKRRGGVERYVHPTAEALVEALTQLRARTNGEAWAPLIRLMVPQRRVPLELARGARPKWLAHQREVNKIVTRTITRGPHPVLWASTWECPFPSRAGILTMPQPDYVLVEDRDGSPHLVFGEHDRGTEHAGTFIARKVELYAGLASFPETCAQLFGMRSFEVRVSVADVLKRRPVQRLRTLAAAAAKRAVPMRFALAGRLHAYPASTEWYDVATAQWRIDSGVAAT